MGYELTFQINQNYMDQSSCALVFLQSKKTYYISIFHSGHVKQHYITVGTATMAIEQVSKYTIIARTINIIVVVSVTGYFCYV